MRASFSALIMAFLFVSSLHAQTARNVDLNQKFTKHNIHRIDVNQSLPMLRDDNFSIDITIGERTYSMALQNSGIVAENYELTVIDDNGESQPNVSRPKAYNGYLLGTSDSRVSLTFNDDFIYGYIREGDKTMFVEPLSNYQSDAAPDEFVTYLTSNIIPDHTHKCGVEKEQEKYRELTPQADIQRVAGQCFEVEWAIVSDFLMFDDFGSVSNVENHNIGVANDVQTNYDDEFADEIQFLIVEQQVFTTQASDPFTTNTDAGTLLDDFTNWGPSGFNQTHDVGSIWTGRNFAGSTIGIAWVGAICTGVRYNALENFTSNASTKRVMVAHELGHNFDADHDASGSPHIMAPSVSGSTTWSATSINVIENFYGFIGCLGTCVGSGSAPTANFISTTIEDCAPGSVVFTDTSTGNATSWQWSFPGGSPSSSTVENPTVTYNTPGVYDVTLVASNGFGGDNITKSDEIEILGIPEVEWFVSTSLLQAFFNNNSSGGDSYFWDFGDDNFSSQEEPIHAYDEDGTYTVTLTVTNSCGADIFTDEVTVATVPTADFTANPTSGCSPMVVNYTSLASSNTTSWSWVFEGGTPNSSTLSNPSVTYNTAGDYDVSLTVSNSEGSDQEERVDFITVFDPATSDFTFSVNGGDVAFTNASVNADSYSWDFGNGDESTDENPNYTFTTSGSYDVVLSATNECGTVMSTQTVDISLAPVAEFSTTSSTTGCAEFSVDFMDESTFNPTTWVWTFEGGSPLTSTQQNPTVSYSVPGEFEVLLTVSNAQGANSISKMNYIVVQGQVEAGFAYNNTALNVSFDNQSSEESTSYVWDFGDGMTSTEQNPNHIYTEEGIYEVTLTATGPCNNDVITQTVNLYTSPTAGFTSDVVSGCRPLTVSYSQTSSSNVTDYSWSFEGGTPATSTDPNPTVTYNTVGVFNVELVVSNPVGNSSATETDYINVLDVPTASFVAVNNMLTVTFTNNSTDAVSYSWDFGDGNTSTEMSPTHTYTIEGDYTVSLTATNSCGDNVSSSSVGANALPSANGSASIEAVCERDEVTFTDMSSDNVTAWLWTFEGGEPATSTDQNPVVTYNTAGSYDVTLEVTAAAGTDVIVFSDLIVVTALPTSSFVAVNNMQTVTFTNNSEGANSYMWDFGDGNTSTEINPVHTYENEDEYNVTLISINECGDVSSTQTVAANSLPTANGTASVTLGCGPTEIQFTDNSSDNVKGWAWTFEGGEPATSTEQNPIVTYNTPGIYIVSLIVNADAGSNEVVYDDLITIIGLPTAEFDIAADDLDYSFTYTGEYGDSFAWDFGDGNSSTDMNPKHTYADYGMYAVTLRASNECAEDTLSQNIDIISSISDLSTITDLKVFPNPTTDRFYIEMDLAEIIDLEMQVMDIHGRLIQKQSLTNLSLKVNKTIDLSDEPSGTYLLRFINGNQVRNTKIVLTK